MIVDPLVITRAERQLGARRYTKRLHFGEASLRQHYSAGDARPFDGVYRDVQKQLFNDPTLNEIDFTAVFCGIGNALKYGLRFEETCAGALTCVLNVYERGAVVRVRTSKGGFDFAAVGKKYKRGIPYWRYAGIGWESYEKTDVLTCFSDAGRAISFFYSINVYERFVGKCTFVPVEKLYLKGTYVRDANTLKVKQGLIAGTGSVWNMALLLLKDQTFEMEPIEVYRDPKGRHLVYEGRHRALAYSLAGRSRIPVRFIERTDPKVKNLSSPHKVNYYKKKFNLVSTVLKRFVARHPKDYRLFNFSKRYLHGTLAMHAPADVRFSKLIPQRLQEGPWPR